jgi:phage-related protein
LSLIAAVERVPERFLKHVEGTKGLYEVRVRTGGDALRIFGFFDEGGSMVLLNAFKKTSERTPGREIALAQELKKRRSVERH